MRITVLAIIFSVLFTFNLSAEIEIDGETYKVIDPHLHTGEYGAMPLKAKVNFTETIQMGVPYLPGILPDFINPYGENTGILSNMELAGVEKGILLAVYAQNTTGYAHNRYLEDLLVDERNKGADGKQALWGMVGVNFDDYENEALRAARMEAISSYFEQRPDLFVGIKLAHAHQSVPFNDPLYHNVFDVAAQYSVPVLMHSGFSPFPGSMTTPEYYNPIYLEDVIKAHDGLDENGDPNDEKVVNMVFAHAGTGDKRAVNDTLDLAKNYPNVYIDLSALSGAFRIDENGDEVPEGQENTVEGYSEEYGQILYVLTKVKEMDIADKAMFATDGPQYCGMIGMYLEKVVKVIKEVGFSKEEITKILSGNAEKVYLSNYEPGPDYSCNANPCVTSADCNCDANWCVTDNDNVSSAGLTKLTCVKKDCTAGDDSTCPLGEKCKEIPSFVIAMMPELPETVCVPK